VCVAQGEWGRVETVRCERMEGLEASMACCKLCRAVVGKLAWSA
jgi:hypothetical protein